MANKPPRIYIPAMETEVTGLPRFDLQASDLLAQLALASYDIFWGKQWRDYEIVDHEITDCEALFAVVDRAWSCSTWMAMEVTWAMGHFSMANPPSPLISSIPTFMYPVSEDAEERFPSNHHAPVILARDVAEAVQQVLGVLPVLG